VVTAPYAKAVHVWDLRVIRRRLKGMGLDWEWDEFPPASESEQPSAQGIFIAIRPNSSADFHFNRGKELSNLRLLDHAIAEFRTALNIDPKHSAAHDWLGSALLDSNELDEAIAHYRKAIEFDPNRATAYNNLGFVLQTQRKLDQAIPCYQRAIALAPKYFRAYENLSSALKAQGKLGEAIAYFRKATEIEPDNAAAINRLAWLLATCARAEFRESSVAVRLAQRAVQLNPGDGSYWVTLGVAHYRAADWTAAVTALERAQTLPGTEDVSFGAFFLAMSYWRLDSKEQARKWYDEAVQWMERHAPDSEELLRFRAEADELVKWDSTGESQAPANRTSDRRREDDPK
jgi:superkiller protein 3